jgi:GTP pyrophosphokinase
MLEAEREADKPRLTRFTDLIDKIMKEHGLDVRTEIRYRKPYSIWRKMRIDHKEFDDVYDLFATRIVYKVPENIVLAENVDVEKLYCFRIYNIIAMLYRIHPDRIKDWVTHPKPSGYQALQMTVMGPDCNWIEIQIRSERMDYEAEYGSAAHWLYKEETAAK